MFEYVQSKAIFSWLLSIVIMGLVLWFALGTSQKQVTGKTLAEAMALRVSGNTRVAVIAAVTAAASYFSDVSKAIATLFISIPEALLLPAGTLYDLTRAVMVFAAAGAVMFQASYRRRVKNGKSKNILPLVGGRTFTLLLVLSASIVQDRTAITVQEDHLFSQSWQVYVINPGVLLLIALVYLGNQIYNHPQTLLTEQTRQNSFRKIYVTVIAYVTVSLIALQVLSLTAALIVLSFVAYEEQALMKSLIKKIP